MSKGGKEGERARESGQEAGFSFLPLSDGRRRGRGEPARSLAQALPQSLSISPLEDLLSSKSWEKEDQSGTLAAGGSDSLADETQKGDCRASQGCSEGQKFPLPPLPALISPARMRAPVHQPLPLDAKPSGSEL